MQAASPFLDLVGIGYQMMQLPESAFCREGVNDSHVRSNSVADSCQCVLSASEALRMLRWVAAVRKKVDIYSCPCSSKGSCSLPS